MPALAVDNMLRPDRRHADRAPASPRRRVDGRRVLQVRAVQPRRLAERSHRAVDDRGRGARGPHPAARIGDRGTDVRQHGRRPGGGGGGQGLQAHPDDARQHVAGAAGAAPGVRRRGAPDARGAGHEGRRRARPGDLPQQPAGVHAACSSRTRPTSTPTGARPAPRSWRSSATACPTRSFTASAPAARSPAWARCCARKRADVRIVAVEPEKSAVLSGGHGRRTPHRRHRRRLRAGDPRPFGAERGAHHLRAGRAAR